MENTALKDYIDALVEKTYGEMLADNPAALDEARIELTQAFTKLYNARLLEKFTPEQLEQAQQLMEQGKFDKISELAYNSGVNFTLHTQEVMQEFEDLYAPSDN